MLRMLQIVNKFRVYEMASIFIAISFYQRILFSFVCFTFNKRMDERPGYGGHYNNDRVFYGNVARAGDTDLLSYCCFQQKEIEYNCSPVAGRL